MFLKDKSRNDLIEVVDEKSLFDPFEDELLGRHQQGEEAQDPEKLKKSDLIFPSGEGLPECWINPHYRDNA